MWAATPRTPPRGVVKIASLMLRDSGQQEVSASVPCTHMLLAICRATADGHDVWAAVPRTHIAPSGLIAGHENGPIKVDGQQCGPPCPLRPRSGS